MRFADRLGGVTLSGIRRVFESAGPDAINLGLGEPDFDTPETVKDAAKGSLDRGETSYTENRGVEELRVLVAERYNELYGTSYGEENVLVTSGASEALHLATEALVNPGDPVAFTDPGFISYPNLAAVAGGKPKRVDTRQESGFVPDPEEVKEELTGEEGLLYLNSPCNPTGAVYPGKDVKALTGSAEDVGVPVVSDEVYDRFVYEGDHISPASHGDDVIVVNSFSKTFAMTGWRLGYLLAPEEVVQECLKIHQYLQACAPSMSQAAGIAALTEARGFPAEMTETFKERRDLLVEGLGDMGIDCVRPRGAFYAFPDVSGFGGGEKVAEELAKRGVLTVPGSAFGTHKGNLRISYAASTEDIQSALEVMGETLPEL